MAKQIDGNVGNFTAGGTIAQYARVNLTAAGVVGVADGTANSVGVARVAAVLNDVIGVEFHSKAGTQKMIAAAAIGVGETVYAATAGKVTTTAGTLKIGMALDAAAADGDLIEVLPSPDWVA